MNVPPKRLTIPQVAAIYDVTSPTIRGWVRSKKLTCIRTPGGQYRFRPEDLEAFEERCLDQESPDTSASTTTGAGTYSPTVYQLGRVTGRRLNSN